MHIKNGSIVLLLTSILFISLMINIVVVGKLLSAWERQSTLLLNSMVYSENTNKTSLPIHLKPSLFNRPNSQKTSPLVNQKHAKVYLTTRP